MKKHSISRYINVPPTLVSSFSFIASATCARSLYFVNITLLPSLSKYFSPSLVMPWTDVQETRTRSLHRKTCARNLHGTEHDLIDGRNSQQKNVAANQYDTHTSYSYELTRAFCTSFSYVRHRHYNTFRAKLNNVTSQLVGRLAACLTSNATY